MKCVSKLHHLITEAFEKLGTTTGDIFDIITARKRSLGQGNMFTSVCLSTVRVPGPGGCLVLGVPGPGGLVLGGVPGPGGCLVPGGGCLVLGSLAPRGLVETPPMASAAGGTHPTGMHSCYLTFYLV